ncbi:hypothetical protein ACFLQX_02955 [Bacteroidota bacterium]
MRYLFKILWKDHSRAHLFWAVLGTLAGFVILLSGIHFYENIKGIFDDNSDLLDPEYILISKDVNIGQAFGFGGVGFTEEEIEEIENQEFAQRVAPFISNEFPVSAFTRNERFPDFYTELFFEAIPDEFIDVKSDEWKWEDGQDYIPIIMPQDYLNLYNFGFAQSQGLPQIPKEVIGLVKFQVRLRGKPEHVTYPGKIVGFSNRINSILVPHDFLSWANETYGYMEKYKPSRVIVVTADPTDPTIMQFIQQKGYDTIKEKLKSSRLNIILKFIISFLVVIAAIIIGLSFLIFLLSLQLMISRSADKIYKLNKMGYHFTEISLPYILLLLILLTGVTALSLIATRLLSGKFAAMAAEWSLQISEKPGGLIYLVSIGLIVLLFVLNTASILISTRRLSKK